MKPWELINNELGDQIEDENANEHWKEEDFL